MTNLPEASGPNNLLICPRVLVTAVIVSWLVLWNVTYFQTNSKSYLTTLTKMSFEGSQDAVVSTSNYKSSSSSSSLDLNASVAPVIKPAVLSIETNLTATTSSSAEAATIENGKEAESILNETGLAVDANTTVETVPSSTAANDTQGLTQQRASVSPSRTRTRTTNPPKNETTLPPTLSACLLMKDDNEIFHEWIAYHYHLWNLRHLVVAVDPTSETSPKPLLELWNQTFDLKYELWQDSHYMPAWFLEGDTSRIPQPKQSLQNKFPNRNFTEAEILQISSHRFRQREFLRQCLKFLDQESPSSQPSNWVVHIDTDEYLGLNPYRLQLLESNNEQLHDIQPSGGSLLQLFVQDFQSTRNDSSSPCVGVPRLLFGGVEPNSSSSLLLPLLTPTNTTTTANGTTDNNNNNNKWVWNKTILESIRWKYHAPLNGTAETLAVNGLPKVLLDLQMFRNGQRKRQHSELMRDIFSIHRPHKLLCPKVVSLDGRRAPLWTVYHFLGSLERYMVREDPRRTEATYWEKASQKEGPVETPTDGWLEWFVREHGLDNVSQVLSKYLVKIGD